MTSRSPKSRQVSSRRAALAIAITALVPLINQARAASETWSATPADGVFSNALNWVSGNVPGATTGTASTDIATFSSASTTTAITNDANRNILGINFTSGSTYTFGTTAGNTLLVSSGGTIQTTNTSGSQVINAPIQIQGDGGTYTFSANTPGSSRTTVFGGAISGVSTAGKTTTLTLDGATTTTNALNGTISDGAGGGNLAIVKNGTGLWAISASGFSGGLTVNAGTLRTGSSGNTTGTLGSGTVTLNGGNILLGSTSATTFNNALSVGSNGGTITFRTNDTFNPSSTSGTGVLTLTNSNSAGTVVGTTDLKNFGGTIAVLANGANSTTLRLNSGFVDASMQNAVLNLGASTSLAKNYGTNGSATTLIGTLAGVVGSSLGGSSAGTGTFIYSVGGRNESSNFAGVIANGSTKTGLTKTGSGTLTLSGTNTYTGGTVINGGAIALGANDIFADAGAITLGGGTLNSAGFSDVFGTLTLTGTSFLDFGSGNSTLLFSAITGAGSLSASNLTSVFDSFRVTSDPTSILGQITINGLTASATNRGSYWEISASAVPEPSSFAAIAGVLGLGFAVSRRRRAA